MKRYLWVFFVAVPMFGQWYTRNNFTVGLGAARPRGDISTGFGDAPSLSVGYGYRFHRNFQADVGLDTGFGAAGVRDYLLTPFGYSRIRDYQFLVPFGGRAILPFFGERFQLSGGGGGAYMRYSELLHQPSFYYQIDCPSCSSRFGWGYYALVGVNSALDRGHHFRLGVTTKMYRGHTNGDPFGSVPPVRTKDQWLVMVAEFGFSF